MYRGSTFKEGEGIDCGEISENYSYEIPDTVVDENEMRLEMSEISYIKVEGIERMSERL